MIFRVMKEGLLLPTLLIAGMYLVSCSGDRHGQCLLGTLMETCSTDLRDLQEKFQSLQSTFNDQTTLLQNLQSAFNDQKAELEALSREILEVRSNVEELNTSSQLTEDKLSPFLSPLETQISDLNDTVTKLDADIPLGHVFGNGDTMVSGGGVANNWNVDSASDFAPILRGDMDFSNTLVGKAFTVPTSGIYYIYGQVLSDVAAGEATTDCGFIIDVGADTYLFVIRTTAPGEAMSHYSSQVRMLNKGQLVTMTVLGSGCRYNFGLDRAFFGLFRLLD